jgi:hypothetical protein
VLFSLQPFEDSDKLCFNLNSLPIVKIEPARSITGKQVPGPKVAFFSSRGPSTKYPTVLKVHKLK